MKSTTYVHISTVQSSLVNIGLSDITQGSEITIMASMRVYVLRRPGNPE